MKKTGTLNSILLLLFSIVTISSAYAQNSYFINKSASPATVQSGQTVTYTIGYSTATAVTGLVITETVPPGFTISSASKPYTQTGNILTFNVGGFAGGYSTITITGTFACGPTCNNSFVMDTATITAQNLTTLTDTAGVTITATNPWKVKKIPVTTYSGGTYYGALGGTVRYMIIVYKNTYCWSCAGELNLNATSITDSIGPGAVLAGVYDQSMNPVSYTGSSPTYSWNSGNLTPTGLNYYYYSPTNTGYCYAKIFYIDIKYPCNAGFTNGQNVPNNVTLSGMLPCGTSPATTTDVSHVVLTDPQASGNFGKTNNIHYTPDNQIPGCTSSYNVGLTNNGAIPMTLIELNDTFPKQLDITSLSISSASYPVNLFYKQQNACGAPSAWIPYASNPITANTTLLKATLVTGGNHIYAFKLTGNSLNVGGSINVGVGYQILSTDWCGGSVIPGTVVQNCANSSYKGDFSLIDSAGCVYSNNAWHGQIFQTSCDTFHIRNPLPNLNLYKYVCAPKPCFQPGDTVRYHLLFNNVGSGPLAAGAVINDQLPVGLTYIGNDSYYSTTYWNSICATGTAITGVTSNNNAANPQWTLPAGLAGSCGNSSPLFWNVDFDVVVNSNAAAGSLSNSYKITGGNLAGIEYSNQATISICPLDSLIAEKQVSIDNGVTWQQSVTVPPGGTAKFRLKIRNVGTVPITNIHIVDVLPAIGDKGPVSCSPRLSQFNVVLNTPLPVPAGSTVQYSLQLNPCVNADLCNTPNCSGCTAPGWAGYSAAARSFKIDYGTFILNPNQTLIYDFDVQVPLTAKKGDNACNSFGYCAKRTNNNINTLAAENYPYACITVGEDTSCNCAGSKWGDITMTNPGGLIKVLQCGGSYPVKCNSTHTVNAYFSCAGQNCPGTVQYKLKEPNGNINAGNAPVTFTASQPGTYTLTLYGLCGNKICDSCVITFKTDCVDCNCDGATWGHITMSWNDIIDHGDPKDPALKERNIITSEGLTTINPAVAVPAQQSINIDCNSPQHGPIDLPCNKTYTITGTFNCNKPGCANVLYNMVYPNGNTNSGTLGTLIFTTSQTGWYSITFYGMCGNDTCKVCVYRFHVDCGGETPECPCPYNISIKDPTVQTSANASPAATIASANFTITGPSAAVFTEIRAEVLSLNLSSSVSTDCINCKNYPFTWASIMSAGTIGAMVPNITMYGTTVTSFNPAGNLYKNPREVIWNSGGTPFAMPSFIGMQFLLPPASIIDCCDITARICVKFTFRDINCKECEVISCFDVKIKK